MKKNSKERLLEVMGRLDKTFKTKQNEDISNEKTFTLNLFGENTEFYFEFDRYRNNNALSVQLFEITGEPYATISVNMPDSNKLENDEFFMKNWSENKEIAKELVDKKIVIPTGNESSNGYVTAKSYRVNPQYAEN